MCAVLSPAEFTCDNPDPTSVRVVGTVALPKDAAGLVVAFGDVDTSTLSAAALQGRAVTC